MLATWHHQFSINIKFLRSFNQHDGIRISYQEHEEYQNTDDENKLNIISLMYWFQTKLYTRVQVNVTKRMKEVTILRCMFLHRHLVFFLKTISLLCPAPFQKCSGMVFYPNDDGEMCTTVLSVLFLIWSEPKKYVSLCRTLVFWLCIGKHLSNTG